jgi:hypothetical protein
LLEKVYEAFDFAASRFIQRLIRKLHPHRACSMGGRARPPGAPLQRKFVDHGEAPMGFSKAWGE